MIGRIDTDKERFKVIEGGRGPKGAVPPCVQLPPPPQMGSAELAAEMAELYAMMLLRDTPFSAMTDPHHAIWIDGRTRFTLHELLCEMRSLSWYDHERRTATPGEPGVRRRQLRLNREGQLTLASMYRGTLAPAAPGGQPLSLFHWIDRCAPDLLAEPCAAPDAEAPMSAWVDWIGAQSGAALALATAEPSAMSPLVTPRDLAFRMQDSHPCRVYYNAALMLLARGSEFDPGLEPQGSEDPVSAQRLLSLMAEGAERAFEAAMRLRGRDDRSSPPATTAARLAAILGRDEIPAGTAPELRGAAEDLQTYAPNLLHWVSRWNAARGRTRRANAPYMLSELEVGGLRRHPSDAALQVVVAGALSTLFKALFNTRPAPHLRMATDPAPGFDLAVEADQLAADVALSAAASGAQFQAESHQNLRIGEALALQVLRGWLAQLPQRASMDLTNFDGKPLRIESHIGRLGAPEVALRRDGRPARFPLVADRPDAHLAVI
ncbi:bromoperoxidase [Salipiger sp. PrR002]|uniref:bromoperoxidase n=1 Tax=Salipiger sp. PrR002 TaxID=2706489 RepID=UPI001F440240|nr:bromoperoxidase [Salipiger sp. PrR002]